MFQEAGSNSTSQTTGHRSVTFFCFLFWGGDRARFNEAILMSTEEKRSLGVAALDENESEQ